MKKLLLSAAIFFFAKFIIDAATPLPPQNIEDHIITSVWEHYCIIDLNKLPEEATEEDYNYFLDVFTETDDYQELYEVYGK